MVTDPLALRVHLLEISGKMPLRPGDVLSFSSGFQQRGPHGYRILRRNEKGGLVNLLKTRWPDMLKPFEGRTPMVINAYPACIGHFDFAVTVDSYLSGSVVSRALMLAELEKLPVMLVGQPLFVADAIFRHLDRGLVLPDTLLIGVGGYPLPRSLEDAMLGALREKVRHVALFQGYGVAEVDAGVLVGVERNERGQVVWHKRDDFVEVEIDQNRLFLSLRGPDGAYVMRRFPTGDFAHPEGDGFVLWNDESRINPAVIRLLESWSPQDWRRRTGYVNVGAATRIQLRRRVQKETPQELEHWDYAKQFGFSWLWKPYWGKGPDLRATVSALDNPIAALLLQGKKP